MSEWLGMLAAPRTPRSELKGRVLARAVARPRRWPLAAAALLVAGAGGATWWAHRTIDALTQERDRLAAQVEALQDTIGTFIHGAGTRLLRAFEAEVARESRHAFLLVSDFNQGAQRFYQRHGYARVGALPGLVLPDVAELIYWKRLR